MCSLAQVVLLLSLLTFWMSEVRSTSPALEWEEFKRQNPDLTKFMTLISQSPTLMSGLPYKLGTIFAPTNDALDEFERTNPNDLNSLTLLYHYSNSWIPIESFEETSIPTDFSGNLPIWVTKVNSDIFLNDAKLIRGDKTVITEAGEVKSKQIVHAINKVLRPPISTRTNQPSRNNNLDAGKYLLNSEEFEISKPYDTKIFANQVQKLDRLKIFKTNGKHTFFLPVSSAFETTRIDSVDNRTIDGHMVVGKAIFLGINEGTSKHVTYETSAAAGNFPVEVTIQQTGRPSRWSVISENLVGDSTAQHHHRKGKVRVDVLRANIPVKNGVVHLISRPLVVIDSTTYMLMQDLASFSGGEKGDGEQSTLSEFLKVINLFPDVVKALNDPSKRFTIFAPASPVFESSNNFKELREKAEKPGPEQSESKKQLEEILKLHIVENDITSEKILNESRNKTHPFSATTLADGKLLYFSVTTADADTRDRRDTISIVDGGGTSATIKQADIGATNGVIHIVNRVLGIGDNTIYDRLKTDPHLKSTYNISLQEGFNQVFRKKDLKFTFFAPFNAAWEGIKYESHSKHKILFDGFHTGHAKRIMERHVISGRAESLEDLYAKTVTGNKTVELKTVRTIQGQIRVVRVDDPDFVSYRQKYGSAHPRKNHTRFHGDYKYVIFWERKEVRVVHGNIKCANGYLHIIDTVLMTPDDIYVNSARDILNSPTLNYIVMILLSFLLI